MLFGKDDNLGPVFDHKRGHDPAQHDQKHGLPVSDEGASEDYGRHAGMGVKGAFAADVAKRLGDFEACIGAQSQQFVPSLQLHVDPGLLVQPRVM